MQLLYNYIDCGSKTNSIYHQAFGVRNPQFLFSILNILQSHQSTHTWLALSYLGVRSCNVQTPYDRS